MPRLDKTGPRGQGPLTGRGMGPCGFGRGRGWGYFGGYGMRQFASPKNELAALENEEEMLKEELAAIHEEIVSLKGQS